MRTTVSVLVLLVIAACTTPGATAARATSGATQDAVLVPSAELRVAGYLDDGPGAVDAARARRASVLVSQMARASSADFRLELATVLDAFADVLAVPTGRRDDPVAGAVRMVRDAARRVRRDEGFGPDAAPPARAGLAAALDALGPVARSPRCPACLDWIAQARSAVDAIDEQSFVVFQRAPLQEACRLIADTLVVGSAPGRQRAIAERDGP